MKTGKMEEVPVQVVLLKESFFVLLGLEDGTKRDRAENEVSRS